MSSAYSTSVVFPKTTYTSSIVLDCQKIGEVKFFITTSSRDCLHANRALDAFTGAPFSDVGRLDEAHWEPLSPPSTPVLDVNSTLDQFDISLVDKLLKNVLETEIESKIPLPPAPEEAQFRWDQQARRICDPTTPLSTPILPSCESFQGQPAYLADLLTAVQIYDRESTRADEGHKFEDYEDTPIRLFIECEL